MPNTLLDAIGIWSRISNPALAMAKQTRDEAPARRLSDLQEANLRDPSAMEDADEMPVEASIPIAVHVVDPVDLRGRFVLSSTATIVRS